MTTKPFAHFTENYLISPTNPLIVNIIGAGGTGNQVLTAIARMHYSLVRLGHPGLFVQLIDDDKVSSANLGRQLFASCDIGHYKSVVLINRINRFFGSAFKAIPHRFEPRSLDKLPQEGAANITISCVDSVAARFEIGKVLKRFQHTRVDHLYTPYYWMDIGNSQHTGQVILSTIGAIDQPKSKKYEPVDELPLLTEQYKHLLEQATEDTTPSCSLAEALTKQDLFINSALSNMAASLLWSMMREGMTLNRGCFLHLKDFRMQPLPVRSVMSILDKA